MNHLIGICAKKMELVLKNTKSIDEVSSIFELKQSLEEHEKFMFSDFIKTAQEEESPEQ